MRFISNCRNPKANRQPTILSTQDLEQALIYCVKMVQQISFAQEMTKLMENKRLKPACLSRHCIPSSIREVFSEWEEDYSNPRFLIKNASDIFALKSSFHKNVFLSRAHKTSSCWATTSNNFSTREILDSKNKKLGENSHSSVHNLL